MILKKLKIKNIRSCKELEIDFPLGSTLLSGDIGVGKTSILLALQFALFGLQPGQKGTSILRQGEENAYVCLSLEIDKKEIIIERTIKQSKKGSISQDSNSITINNQKQELSTLEMKNKVISILNYPKEFVKKSNLLYRFTVYTPQEAMKEIIQERPEIRLDTLRHVFGVDRYKRIKENLQILIQKIKEAIKIKEAQISEINLLKEKLSNKTEQKIKITRDINNLNLEFQKLQSQKQESELKLNSIREQKIEKQKLDLELSTATASLSGKNDFKERMQKEIERMQKEILFKVDFFPQQLQNITNLLQKHKNILEENNKNFMEINSKISVLNSKKEQSFSLSKKISNMENCPTCFQKVEQGYKEKIAKNTKYNLEEINRELEQELNKKTQLEKDIEKEKIIISGYEQDKANVERNKIKFEHQRVIDTKIKSDVFILERTLLEIKQLELNIASVKQKSESFKEIEIFFIQYQKDFEEVSKNLQSKQIVLAEKNKELEILKESVDDLQEDIKRKEKIKNQVDYLRQLQDWLQEKFLSIIILTEKNVLAKLRNEFSNIFSEWFAMLVSDQLSVRLDEDFTPIISNQDYEIDYSFLSGGERTAVALAYRLALNQVLNSLMSKIKTKGLVILDEPTDGFSDSQLDKMRDIFEQLESEQLILVSHEQKIEGFVDNIIKIKKEGESTIDNLEK